jgi:hypothetical protein
VKRAAVAAGVLVALGSCTWTKHSPTDWDLAAPVDGSRLELAVLIPGTEACRPYVGVEIREDDDVVRITARVRRSSGDDCPAADDVRQVVVELEAPLGDRELTGCRPRSSAAGPQPDPGPDCGR